MADGVRLPPDALEQAVRALFRARVLAPGVVPGLPTLRQWEGESIVLPAPPAPWMSEALLLPATGPLRTSLSRPVRVTLAGVWQLSLYWPVGRGAQAQATAAGGAVRAAFPDSGADGRGLDLVRTDAYPAGYAWAGRTLPTATTRTVRVIPQRVAVVPAPSAHAGYLHVAVSVAWGADAVLP